MRNLESPPGPPKRFIHHGPRAVLATFVILVDPKSRDKRYVVPLGGRLERLRVAHSHTQASLARRSGVGQTTIYELESKFRRKYINTMDVLAKTLKIDMSLLIVSCEVIRLFAHVAGPTARGIDWVLDAEFDWVVELVNKVIERTDDMGSIVDGIVLPMDATFDDKCLARIEDALEVLANR